MRTNKMYHRHEISETISMSYNLYFNLFIAFYLIFLYSIDFALYLSSNKTHVHARQTTLISKFMASQKK